MMQIWFAYCPGQTKGQKLQSCKDRVASKLLHTYTAPKAITKFSLCSNFSSYPSCNAVKKGQKSEHAVKSGLLDQDQRESSRTQALGCSP